FVDPTTGRNLGAPITTPYGIPVSLAWSTDGRLLAVATWDNILHIYDAHTRRQVVKDIESVDAKIVDLTFDRDATRVIGTVDNGVTRQWDARTGEEIQPALEAQRGIIGGVAYSPDYEMLATTAIGLSSTRLWEMPSGRTIGADLVGGRVPYTSRNGLPDVVVRSRPAFAPDGKHLATPGADGASTLWDLDPAHWVRAACAVAGRDLTAAEWREQLPAQTPFALCE